MLVLSIIDLLFVNLHRSSLTDYKLRSQIDTNRKFQNIIEQDIHQIFFHYIFHAFLNEFLLI